MRKKGNILVAGALLAIFLAGCNTHSPVTNQQPPSTPTGSNSSAGSPQPSASSRNIPARPNTPNDEVWYSKNPGWYEKQLKQDCPEAQQDPKAIDAVLRAYRGDKKQFKFGEKDPFDRKPDILAAFKSRPNPLGEGAIISAYKDNERGADYNRRRSVWLVVDGKVYPLNTNAAGNVGVLFGSPPPAILKRAGLIHSYVRGETMLDQLGFEEFTYVRAGSNPFPMCP